MLTVVVGCTDAKLPPISVLVDMPHAVLQLGVLDLALISLNNSVVSSYRRGTNFATLNSQICAQGGSLNVITSVMIKFLPTPKCTQHCHQTINLAKIFCRMN